jgi:hypothetical protein
MQMGIGKHICHKCSKGRCMYRFLREVAIKFRASPKWGVRWEKEPLVLSLVPDVIFRRGNHRDQDRNVCQGGVNA